MGFMGIREAKGREGGKKVRVVKVGVLHLPYHPHHHYLQL
jgi:hypothetical protein